MKELSIEQKAQRYDEAYKRVAVRFGSNVADEIFPELKESEGERIRKALIELVHDTTGDSLWVDYNVHKEDAIDWLEKQGEQKLYVNDNAKEMFIKALERVEEQNAKGYKLTDCDKNSWWEDFKNYTSCTIEQKPTGWSEKLIADVFEMVGLAKIVREQENDALTRALQSAMIELAKYSVVPQIRQEWSEEDKILLKLSLENLTELKDRFGEYYGRVGGCIDWLKSLRPQSQWKPSEEQLKALNAINVTGCISYAGQGQELVNLFNDLKKLKE